ncbi:MAG: PKD domain-containing protein [Planctomycetes bacterium]|nr:PKD domain-containing protein [Planctomycetota bacterium]
MTTDARSIRSLSAPRGLLLALAAIALVLHPLAAAAQPAEGGKTDKEFLWVLSDGNTVNGRFISFFDGKVVIEPPDGKRREFTLEQLSVADRKKIAELENTDAPGVTPPWVPGYRIRYTLRVLGDVLNTPSKTVVARIPSGGWLKPDATDIQVRSASGKQIPVAVVSHDPKGDTLIQFRHNGMDRWYWVYAMNPAAPPRDEVLFAKIDQTKKDEAAALLHKMELQKTSAEAQVVFRNITNEVEKQKQIVTASGKELVEWAKLMPEREAAAKAALQKAEEAKPVLAKAQADEKAAIAVADLKIAAAKPSGDAAAAARAKSDQAAAAAKAAVDALAALQAQVKQADTVMRAKVDESVAADKDLRAAKTPQERDAAQKTAKVKSDDAKAAHTQLDQLQAKVPAAQALATKTQATATAEDQTAKAAEQVAAGPAEESKQARMASAKTTTVRTEAEATLNGLVAAANAAQAQVVAGQQAIAAATKVRDTAQGVVNQLTPKFDALKAAAEAAMAASAKAVTDSQKVTEQLYDLAADADPTVLKEGLTVEFREWGGDRLTDWPTVVGGLLKSDNVLGNALVTQVIQNVNPFRRSQARNFAASYRGHLKIDKGGVYSFMVNGDDSAFLFIDGYRVYTRTGTNAPIRGSVPLYSIGADIELEPGIHRFEVHSVIGNTPWATGLCAFLWLPPGARQWAFVPESAFVQGVMAAPVMIEEAGGAQAAVLDYGMDDALVSDGVTLYLTRFEAQGAVKNPAQLRWDFGDGTTATGRSVTHIYFREGDYEVTLNSGGSLPPFRRRFHVWTPPVQTSPLALPRTVEVLGATNLSALSVPQLNAVFDFLLICEQPTRWPLLEKVCRLLLAKPGLDIKYRVFLNTQLMESLARQGRGADALKLMDPALKEVGKVQTLRGRILLRAAEINRTQIKDFSAANTLYGRILDEYRRLKHPVVVSAAVSWGDMYLEGGDQARAGDSYRLAQTLAGDGPIGETQGDAVKRGALLRVAEQQLKAGDIRQTRRMLERIEHEFPEQKLEGLYRFLRAESDRYAGRYDEAIRHYEVLLQLKAWAGYWARGEFGMADSYYRMGDYKESLERLKVIETDYADYFAERHLADYRAQVEARRARFKPEADPKAVAGTPPPKPETVFAGVELGFEPEQAKELTGGAAVRFLPSMGLDGSYTAFIEATPAGVAASLPPVVLRNLPAQGTLWVEFWYREMQGPAIAGDGRAIRVDVYDAANTDLGFATVIVERTFGMWHKAAFNMPMPRTTDGKVVVTIGNHQGLLQIDGLKVLPVSDTQNDSLRTFIEGADPQ